MPTRGLRDPVFAVSIPWFPVLITWMGTISEFHYATIFVEGNALASAEALHDELAFKLQLPIWHGKDWNDLRAALTSIGKPTSHLCGSWEFLTGKRMVLQIRRFWAEHADPTVLSKLLQIVATANNQLLLDGHGVRIWLEFVADTKAMQQA